MSHLFRKNLTREEQRMLIRLKLPTDITKSSNSQKERNRNMTMRALLTMPDRLRLMMSG